MPAFVFFGFWGRWVFSAPAPRATKGGDAQLSATTLTSRLGVPVAVGSHYFFERAVCNKSIQRPRSVGGAKAAGGLIESSRVVPCWTLWGSLAAQSLRFELHAREKGVPRLSNVRPPTKTRPHFIAAALHPALHTNLEFFRACSFLDGATILHELLLLIKRRESLPITALSPFSTAVHACARTAAVSVDLVTLRH
jgi:hypothetical protein